jgi:hypothetical protein
LPLIFSLWPSGLIGVNNATLVVSGHVYMQQPSLLLTFVLPRPTGCVCAQGMNQEAALEMLNDMLEQEQLAAVAAAAAQRGQGGPAMSTDALRATNPLLMLLQSMLPWVNAGEQPDYAAGGSNGAAGGQQQQGQQDGQPPAAPQ